MKETVLTILLLSALTFLLLSGCTGGAKTPEEERAAGGIVTDATDPNAPKTVESKEITGFHCRFSLVSASDPGALGNKIYTLDAVLENGAVTGSYTVSRYDAVKRSVSAADGPGFMAELQALVERHDLARYNGRYYNVSGLPREFGSSLDVRYASGESIRASNNQSCFLSMEEMADLAELFERYTAVTPELLDFSASDETEMRQIEGGWGIVSTPVYALGSPAADGGTVPPEGFEAAAETVAGINGEARERAEAAWNFFEAASEERELHVLTDAFVTRADSEAISFYERARRYETLAQDEELLEYYAHNIDARTGRELSFSDVFRDVKALPEPIAEALRRAYPEETFSDDLAERIAGRIAVNNGGVSFALSYGCVHILVDGYTVKMTPVGYHVTLPYAPHPGLVRAYYETAPARWLLPLDYDVSYWPGGTDTGFRLQSRETPDSGDVLWEIAADGGDVLYAEPFFGAEPRCFLAHTAETSCVYLREPVGDASMLTRVYQLAEGGVTPLTEEPLRLALRADSPLNPDRMLMNLDEPVFTPAVQLLPYGTYRVGGDGLPESVGGVYKLDGPWVLLRESGRYNPDSRENAAVSGGMWNLAAGQRLRPYQTDLETYLDFLTEDGRVVRFEIDKFSYDMRLDNFGTLDDVFAPEGVG